MLMTTSRLIVLRILSATLCRSAIGAALLRRALVRRLVHRATPGRSYSASARFFDPRELE